MESLLKEGRRQKDKSSSEQDSPILFCCRHPGKPRTWMSFPWGVLQLPSGLQEKISSQCFFTVPPLLRCTSAQHLALNLEGFLMSFYVHTYYPHKKVRLNYALCTVGGLNTAVQQTTCSLSTLWERRFLKYPVIFCHQMIWKWNCIKQQRRANRFHFISPEVIPFTWSVSIAVKSEAGDLCHSDIMIISYQGKSREMKQWCHRKRSSRDLAYQQEAGLLLMDGLPPSLLQL